MQKIISIVFVLVLLLGIGLLLTREESPNAPISSSPTTANTGQTTKTPTAPVSNVEVKDGIQYVTVTAKGGYAPRLSQAKAGVPTKLIVKTNGTYDCSSSLIIRDAKFEQILPQTGETTIDLGTPEAGKTIQGICGMGMYNFQISFK